MNKVGYVLEKFLAKNWNDEPHLLVMPYNENLTKNSSDLFSFFCFLFFFCRVESNV